MNHLTVDVNSGEWLLVKKWAELRIAEQAEICTNPAAPEGERLMAAVRCDELKTLLAAPAQALRLSQQREETRSTY